MVVASHSSQSSSSHSNLALIQALDWINSRICSWKGWREILEAQECVQVGRSNNKWMGGWGGINTRAPKTSRYWAFYAFIGISDQLDRKLPESPLPELTQEFRSDPTLEHPTQSLSASREHFYENNRELLRWVGTSDPYKFCRYKTVECV